jgi:surface protein
MTSTLQTESHLFHGCTHFNDNFSTWDVSNMHGMFSEAHSLNQPLEGWNVSNVT